MEACKTKYHPTQSWMFTYNFRKNNPNETNDKGQEKRETNHNNNVLEKIVNVSIILRITDMLGTNLSFDFTS